MTNMLPLRRVGRTDLCVPALGMGTASMGNLYAPISERAAQDALQAGVDCGLCYIDTAQFYGFGLSEQRVGNALQRRSDIVVSTKVGRVLEPCVAPPADRSRHGFVDALPFDPVFDYTYDGVLRSHAASLQRLGVDRIDILYVHDIGTLTHGRAHHDRMAELTGGGGLSALTRLRDEGAVSAIGIGVNEIAVCLEMLTLADLDVILLAGRYTLLEQTALDELLPRCTATGTSVVIGGPFNSGILAVGSDHEGGHYDYATVPETVRDRVRRIERICIAHDVALPAAAIQFVLAHPVVVSVVPGLASVSEVHDAVRWTSVAIPDALWTDLKSEGLLHVDAPSPALDEGYSA